MNTQSLFSFTPRRFFSIVTLLYILFVGISSGIIFVVSIRINNAELESVINRIKEDIRYRDGVWDMSYLNSDPELPTTHSHYIVTTDGYVIERWRAINGFMNTSDMNYLLQFETPQTIVAPTQEKWRMVSWPIRDGDQTLGVFAFGHHISIEDDLAVIDDKLNEEMKFVMSKTVVQDGRIDASKLDIRQTQYDISFKLVDRHNNVLVKTNNSNSIERTPNYLDRSYVADEIENTGFRIIRDAVTRKPFLIVSSPVLGEKNAPVGVVIVGKSLSELQNLLFIYMTVHGILLLIAAPLLWFLYKQVTHKPMIRHLHFDTENGIIEINNESVEIPRDTNQFVLSRLIFKQPMKGWEVDEVATHFDDKKGNVWRKVYDAMLLVNKRVEPLLHDKLVMVADKKFCMNPKFTSHIK